MERTFAIIKPDAVEKRLAGKILARIPFIQQIVIGVIIVLAVAFDTFAKSRRRKV